MLPEIDPTQCHRGTKNTPHRRRIFGREVESDCDLPDLPIGHHSTPELSVQRLPESVMYQEPDTWVRLWHTEDGRFQLGAARTARGFLLRFPGVADFLLSPDALKIEYRHADSSASPGFIHALLDQVIPRLLAQTGGLVLHASAISSATAGACLVGQPRAGKSTLAAAMHKTGMALLADDAILLQPQRSQVLCFPAYPGVRLWRDSADHVSPESDSRQRHVHDRAKLRCCVDSMLAGAATQQSVDVQAIFLLHRELRSEQDFSIRTALIPPKQAVVELMTHAFKLDVRDRRHWTVLLAQVACTVDHLPVYRLAYPTGYQHLPAVCHEVQRLLDDHSALSTGRKR